VPIYSRKGILVEKKSEKNPNICEIAIYIETRGYIGGHPETGRVL
jgi:hypothetical protein